ncbi:SufE family protein [Flammeovirgaceae bacterium SG7u.111]|nr:SufE family protein [Flammeovirgaceae bacterium SG7u.132]WPO33634.1 SufE family protein [Flammeovirgaceae bacterium SG7u.111]
MSINEVQDEIVSEFEILGDDRESMIFYIMEIGEKAASLPEEHLIDDNIIKGCQSKVWLITELEGDKIKFEADSNTALTKGLIQLLIRVLSGRKPAEILDADLYFLKKIGLQNVIGSQRSNGLAAMVKQMRLFAVAYKAKIDAGS